MAGGTYISINTSNIDSVSAQATALGRQLEETRSTLKKLQSELSGKQNVLENRYGICFDDVIPTKRLKTQQIKMDHIVSLLSQAEQLAKNADNKLNTRTSALRLAVAAMSLGGISGVLSASAKSVISAVLSGETDGGDEWAEVGNWGPTPEEITSEMEARYQRMLKATGRTSFSGACSAFVYRQLCDIGVFKLNKDSGVAKGKDYYSVWGNKSTTSTGYLIESYGYDSNVKNNPLQDLINAHSGETLENIVVSFNYDGKNYTDPVNGHVMMITAIRDGNVYYMESAKGALWNVNPKQTYKEGEPICLSVSDFMKQYPNMNGVVHFYK